MTEKVKVLLLEREDHQRSFKSLSLEYKQAVSAGVSLDSIHSPNKTDKSPSSLRRDRSSRLDLSKSQKSSDSKLKDLDSSGGRTSVFGRKLQDDMAWGARARTEEAEVIYSEMSSDIGQDTSGISSSSLKEHLAQLGSYDQKLEQTLGRGNLNGHDWIVTSLGSDLRLYVGSKLSFSSDDWRFNPHSLFECLERFSQMLDSSTEQAVSHLKEVLDELKSAQHSIENEHTVARNTSYINIEDHSGPIALRTETEQSEPVNFSPELEDPYKSSDASLELSTYSSKQKPQASKTELDQKSREVQDLKRINKALQEKSTILQQRLAEDVEEVRFKAMRIKQLFSSHLAKLPPQKDTKTEEFINMICSLFELTEAERVSISKQRQGLKKGFFSSLL
mmetsp:Transcript_4132/g.8350  ORF Transcript_4132/g.8350 Transcript_4132/m.8350 type:complete len:391 (-) Transcript_4132:7-1179(-)